MTFILFLAVLATAAAVPLDQNGQLNITTTTTTLWYSDSPPTPEVSPLVAIEYVTQVAPVPVATETIYLPPPTAETIDDTNPDVEYESTVVLSVPAGTSEESQGDVDLPSTADTPSSVSPAMADDDFYLLIELYNGKADYVPLYFGTGRNAPQPIVDGDGRGINPNETLSVYVQPDYEGMIALGNAEGSKVEISYSAPSGYVPHADVSFVDGFTHELVCSCGGVPITGCNKNLWEYSSCTRMSSDGVGCLNPARRQMFGPADDFFAPCQGVAYTFPHDDSADRGCPGERYISCCIGPDCEAPYNQL